MALRIFLLILISLIAGGCASTQELSNDPRDPLEGFNRAVYTFNDTLDHTLLTPLAIGYRAITPEFAETGINNFLNPTIAFSALYCCKNPIEALTITIAAITAASI